MENDLFGKFLIPAGIFLGITAALFIFRGILFRVLHRWAEKTETVIDDIIIKGLKGPSLFWCIAIGIYSGLILSEIPDKYTVYLTKAIYVVMILSVTAALSNISGRVFKYYVSRSELPIPATGLAHGLIKGTIFSIGIIITLNAIGISITPILTALGVGGLAVALALQDTLANLFAGMHLLMERSVRVGDFVRLESGQEGYVTDIGWRTTKVRMVPNNLVIIPNSKLAQSVLVNYYLPEPRMSLQIPVSVSYDSDPEKVERVLVDEVKKAVGAIPGLLGEPEPNVRFMPGFGESSLDFTLACQIREFSDQFGVQHELRKRIFRRFNEEGIIIPYPHRTVYLKGEKGDNPR